MKNYLSTKFVLIAIFPSFIVTPLICAAETSPGFVKGIAVHTNHLPTKRKDNVPHENLYHETFHGWKRYEKISDSSVRVFFEPGAENCNGGYRAVLQEKDDSIEIGIIIGQLENVDEIVCRPVQILDDASFLLHTQKPIGNRPIVPLTSVELLRNK